VWTRDATPEARPTDVYSFHAGGPHHLEFLVFVGLDIRADGSGIT